MRVPGGRLQNSRRMKVVSLSARPPLRSGWYSWHSFLLEAETTPELNHWKIPMTESGIETATSQLTAQCLNHLHYRLPPVIYNYNLCIHMYSHPKDLGGRFLRSASEFLANYTTLHSRIIMQWQAVLLEVCGLQVCHTVAAVYDGNTLSHSDILRNVLDSSWNVMVHSDARGGKWRGNWRMEWVASTLHNTSKRGVSSIAAADAHASAVSSRLNWRPPPI